MREAVFLTLVLLLGYGVSIPASPIQNDHHDSNQNPALQETTPSALHSVDSEKSDTAEGDPSLTQEVVLGDAEQDNEIEEEPEEDVLEEEDITADKRGGGGSLHRTHNRKNHTVGQRSKRSEDKSSEEDKLDLLSDAHVAHKRAAHDGQHENQHEIGKRAVKEKSEEEESDGSFDGLEYIGEQDENEERRKRNHHHQDPEESVEFEDPPPTFPSDIAQHAQSVALRVKRVNKAGSSHRNRLINKSKGNSKAGQAAEEQHEPSVMIESV